MMSPTLKDLLVLPPGGCPLTKKYSRRRALFSRLLTSGHSDDLFWNVARKVGYLLTLPLRLVAPLFAAAFAIHNRPLGALLAFLALFGFWEVFDAIAKQPLTGLFEAKSKEYQFEVNAMRRAKSGEWLSSDVLYSNFRAAKFVMGAEIRALKAGFTDDGTRMKHESSIDYFMRKMSRSLDKETEIAVAYRLGTISAVVDNKAPRFSESTPAYPEQRELVVAEAEKQRAAKRAAEAEKQRNFNASGLADVPAFGHYTVVMVMTGRVRYAPVPDLKPGQHLRELHITLANDRLTCCLSLLPMMGGPENNFHAGANIPGVGPGYLCEIPGEGYVLIPVSDYDKNTKLQQRY